MTNASIHSLDIRLLRYFAVVAEENNMSRAAQRLFMSQPPLSRHIRQLEERLGVTLFVRHTRGLTLTEEGARVLAIVRPLLAMQEKTYAALDKLGVAKGPLLRIGLTTAFEQGVFTPLEDRLRAQVDSLRIVRRDSLELVRQVQRGKLDAALVALPLETSGLSVISLDWQEALIAALPAIWPEAESASLSLLSLNSRPLFWFKRERNPAFFDYTRQRFQRAGYVPSCIEEPLEHDVLLARIAKGEGLSLLPASFAAIQRQGVVFRPLSDKSLRVSAGVVVLPEKQAKLEWLIALLRSHCIAPE
ncbi:LysR family transcriptional regulator [Pseudocitrobacter cyperus]|uniref:LysR family transcriptional regulator n=1 Tax=Pseudocitrobacter cyperus TaxID=3112843 RepID=A0ABV0HPS9_9ENTR